MAGARSGKSPNFPIFVEKNGRIGRISFWKKSGVYGTYFRYGGHPHRSSFATLDGARGHLESEFQKLDNNQLNSVTLYPVRNELRVYHELEELLRERGNGARCVICGCTKNEIAKVHKGRANGPYYLNKFCRHLAASHAITLQYYCEFHVGMRWPRCPVTGSAVGYKADGKCFRLATYKRWGACGLAG